MKKKKLGNTDFEITSIGLGAWAMGGNNWQFGWGKQDDNQSIKAIHKALDSGINWIDTAAVYGLGHAEEVVAKALKGMNEKPYVFTKCELRWDDKGQIYGCMKKESIKEECEASLKRLQVEIIDLYQIHWPNPDNEIEEGWETLQELKMEGKIRYAGVSNFSVSQMERIARIAPISSLQPPYSLSQPEAEKEIIPYCEKNNIGVIVYSPMMSGLLSGKMTRERISSLPDDDWRKRSPEFNEPKLTKNLLIAEKLKDIGKKYGVEAGAIAIAWTLRLSGVTGAIVGARSPEQVDLLISAGNITLEKSDIDELNKMIN
ncbi:MAG: aldo/keto reductase [Ignavibacteria bacterium]|nr:aldo/keto reductase [Ignavibacteria bacterium]